MPFGLVSRLDPRMKKIDGGDRPNGKGQFGWTIFYRRHATVQLRDMYGNAEVSSFLTAHQLLIGYSVP